MNHFDAELEIVATVAGEEIQANVMAMHKREATSEALRSMVKRGVSVDELSEASGLTTAEIRARLNADSLV